MQNPPKTRAEAENTTYVMYVGDLAGYKYNQDQCADKVWLRGEEHPRQCRRKPGHGPSGLYCAQHARKVEAMRNG